MRMHRHHLLEIILWPNGDGTFRKILNSKERLRELGIYDDWKLTITIPADEHIRMHNRNRSAEHRAKISAAQKGNTYAKGKRSEEVRAKMSAAQKGNTNVRGRRWYNNGITSIRARECPPGFAPGQLRKKKSSEL